ncbi:hypothetical protein OK016_04985 [Vibrio chagasii]|nr:hypothetical protein [Vibrio chagasii]
MRSKGPMTVKDNAKKPVLPFMPSSLRVTVLLVTSTQRTTHSSLARYPRLKFIRCRRLYIEIEAFHVFILVMSGIERLALRYVVLICAQWLTYQLVKRSMFV